MQSQAGRSGPKRAERGQQGELAVLERIRARAARAQAPGLRLGIGDDCALLRIRAGEELAVTTDLSIAGIHFRLDWHTPEEIGHRTLVRGLSDLAAMSARPVAAFLSLGLPRELVQNTKRRKPWVERFLDGFFALAEAHDVPLAGGDLAESATPVADIVLTGAVKRGHALLRSGARSGDRLYVSGNLGGGVAGLARVAQLAQAARPDRLEPRRTRGKLEPLLERYLYPEPRIRQGLWLMRASLATAAIDLSDGLSTDLAHLCEESGVAAEIDAAALPIHPDADLEQALHGGDDYELLFTASPSVRVPRRIAGVPITCIGRILRRNRARPPVTLITASGARPLAPGGWQHFS